MVKFVIPLRCYQRFQFCWDKYVLGYVMFILLCSSICLFVRLEHYNLEGSNWSNSNMVVWYNSTSYSNMGYIRDHSFRYFPHKLTSTPLHLGFSNLAHLHQLQENIQNAIFKMTQRPLLKIEEQWHRGDIQLIRVPIFL